MKRFFILIVIIITFKTTQAQDSNILTSLNTPAFGIRMKMNFPSINGAYARGYFIVNEDNTKGFLGLGVKGIITDGKSTMDYGWLGPDWVTPHMTFLPNGNVGIATFSPTEKLSVKGKIRAQEIKVENANWPDYVFSNDHNRLTLPELERYIKSNRHLPEVPSAAEVKNEGVDLGAMNATLLKKIEELTLYLIEQGKEINAMKEEITDLKNQ